MAAQDSLNSLQDPFVGFSDEVNRHDSHDAKGSARYMHWMTSNTGITPTPAPLRPWRTVYADKI